MDDPRQWLQFGGQDMERAPTGLPIGQAVGTSAAYHGVEGLEDAARLANQVSAGEVNPMSDEGIQRALNAAMVAQMGGFAGAPARAGEKVLGSGPVRRYIKNLKGEQVEPPTMFYRGTNPESTERIRTGMSDWDSYLFAADNLRDAGLYGSQIEKIQATPEAKILYEGTKDWNNIAGKWRKNENLLEYANRAANAAKEAGYDAAWFKRQGDVGTSIFNPDVFVRNYSDVPNKAHGGEVDAALHAVRHHLAGGGFLSDLFSGPDIMSTGEAASPTNWGDPESAADFFKADKALRLAREAQAAGDVIGSIPVRAPLTAPRPGAVEERELPPAPVRVPFSAPDRDMAMPTLTGPAPLSNFQTIPGAIPPMSSDFQRIVPPAPKAGSIAAQPIAYSPEPEKNPARVAIEEATGKLAARAPQGPDLTDRDRDLIIRTIAAETSGKTPEESQAIAHVILNRIESGRYGKNPEAVLFAPKQFEPWSNPAGANYPMRFAPESRRYRIGQEALDAALGADDITGGATNFWAPKAQAALGRAAPKWGRTGGVDIGETRFHKLGRAEGGEIHGDEDMDHNDVVSHALHALRHRYATDGFVNAEDPRQWLQFGGQDMERAPAGLPIGQAVGTSAAYHTGESLADAAKLANQVQAGEVDPVSDEGVQRALSAAMAAQTGGLGGVSARAGETVLGAGPVRKAAPDEVSGLFDYSRLNEVPKVAQFDLPRNIPPRGVPERVTDIVNNQDVRDLMMKKINEGQSVGGANWYNTDPLRDKFIEQLGADAGDRAHRKYMDFVAATSPRSKVDANVRNASYYYGREMRGEGMPAVGEKNPFPYGHLAQRLHQMNAERVAGPGWEPLNNPKVASFVENLVGNQLPATVDTHALRLPGMLAKDPRFLETAYQASKDAPKLNIQKLVQSGDMSMEDALKTAAYWQAYPKPNEYAALEQYYKSLAREMGMTPAQTQASAWIGGGKMTGLASDESKPFLRFFDDRLMKTANETGMDPKDVLRDFISGKAPLYAKGGSVEDRALMLVSQQA